MFDVEKDEKLQCLEPELKTHESIFSFSEASKDFVIQTHPARLGSNVYGVATMRPFALWLFVGKQTKRPVSAFNNQLRFFTFHEESIVYFDPGGRADSGLLFTVCKAINKDRLW